jgi:hypothetical protein
MSYFPKKGVESQVASTLRSCGLYVGHSAAVLLTHRDTRQQPTTNLDSDSRGPSEISTLYNYNLDRKHITQVTLS